MSRCVVHVDKEITERQRSAINVMFVDRRRLVHAQAEHRALLLRGVVQKLIGAVQVHGRVECALGGRNACHVIEVSVREQDADDAKAVARGRLDEHVHLIAGVDQDALFGAWAA
jgi:hypothetical protein